MSTSSHRRDLSQASSSKRPLPPVAIIVTTPPWAKDETSSNEDEGNLSDGVQGSEHRTSEAHSRISSHPETPSRWWVFNDPHNRVVQRVEGRPPFPKSERKSLRDISLSWMSSSVVQKNTGSSSCKGKEVVREKVSPQSISSKDPNIVSQTMTHGLNTPRVTKSEASSAERINNSEGLRKNTLRSFILTNIYIPLLFRFINISFTTTALALSICIRNLELNNSVLGAIGSSPTVVIIFAPPTLVHVFVAIYLEYFGRPLGLWRTSGKLAHTLVEVLFICLWSAALSIAFDNFFTSLIPCASPSAISWYNQLPRPVSTIPTSEEALGVKICGYQLSLICLVGLGLVAYCSNLIISLYRIFEKVKYHAVSPSAYQ